MKIYAPNNTLILDTEVDDSSLRYKEIMGDNNLSLDFSHPEHIPFELGSWCEFKNERYTLYNPENFTFQHSEHYDYKLLLEAYIAYSKFVKFKFFIVERNGSEEKMVGSPKLKFSLTATPADFAQLFVDNMNFSGDKGWLVGECIDSEPVTIDFNHDYCFGVLQKFADAFKTEWEADNKTLHIRKVEKRKEFPVNLKYGYDEGILGGIKRTQFDDSKVINRVWIEAGDRNINRDKYGNETLLLPKNSVFEHEGKQYRTDTSGSFVEPVERIGTLSEDSLDVSKIYPRRVGVVSSVIAVDDSKGLYDFIDLSIPESLDFSKMVIPKETMVVIFQTGQLASYPEGFEVKYIHSSRKFQIAHKTENGLTVPKGNIIPAEGDKYGVFKMTMPAEYIESAEIEARDEAVKYLFENSQPKYTYELSLDGNYAKRNWGSIGGYLNVGYFIEFSNSAFLPDPVAIRIVNVKEYVNKPKSPVIQISNNVTGKSLPSALNEIQTQEQATERKDSTVISYAKRRFQDTQELIDGLYDPSGSFQNDVVSALALRSIVLALGDPLLQYMFVSSNWQTEIDPQIEFDSHQKKIICSATRIKHMTLNIEGVQPNRPNKDYLYWNVAPFSSDVLADSSQAYYLYLSCDKTPTENSEGLKISTANFFISETKIDFGANPMTYTLLVGFFNSENEEGERGLTLLYGFSEMSPNMLRINKLVSMNGLNWFNLLTGALRAGRFDSNGNMIQGVDVDPDREQTMIIKGAVVQSPSGDKNVIGVFRGVYNDVNEYFVGDEVTYLGSTYRCISNTQTGGIPPTEETYWKVIAQKGTSGTNGNYTSYVFKQSATEPTKPTGTNPLPSGWVDAPTSSGTWWMSKALVNGSTNQAGSWSAVVRVTGQNGANGADGGFIAFIYAKNTSLTVPPAIDKTVILPSGWSVEPVSLGVGEFMWMAQAQISANGELADNWSDPVRISGEKGEKGENGQDGENGKNGRIFSYRGDYSASASYKGNAEVAEIVRYNNTYYYTKEDAGTITGIAPNNTSKWVLYGASFESVATGLLFAKEATIAGFNFTDYIIKSTKLDENGNPVLVLDGVNGNVQMAGSFLGKLETSTQSTRIVIDPTPSAQEIQFYYEDLKTGEIGINTRSSEMRSAEYSTRGKDSQNNELFVRQNANGIYIYRNNVLMFRVGFDILNGTLILVANNLPTTAQNKPSGTIWRNGSSLGIVP